MSLLLLYFLIPVFSQLPSLLELGGDWLLPNVTVGNMPTITNFWGSSSASANSTDIMGVSNFDLFPFTGFLQAPIFLLDETNEQWHSFSLQQSQWFAHQFKRASNPITFNQQTWNVTITNRLQFEGYVHYFTIAIQNSGQNAQTVRMDIHMSGGVRKVESMPWVVPLPNDDGSFPSYVDTSNSQASILRFLDSITPSVLMLAYTPQPDAMFNYNDGTKDQGAVTYNLNLKPGQIQELTLVMLVGTDNDVMTDQMLTLLKNVSNDSAASDQAWNQRWQDAFTPNNKHFSGYVPTLTSSNEAVKRMYYMGILTALTCERTNWNKSPLYSDSPRLYSIGYGGLAAGGAPGNRPLGGSAFWFWDESYASLTLSLLDPIFVRAYLKYILPLDWSRNNAIDLISGLQIPPWPRGFGGGDSYAFNSIALFLMLSQYLQVTNDTVFLQSQTQNILNLATHWQLYDADQTYFAVYSQDQGSYLECVPHYYGAVGALQSANVWMMRSSADLFEKLGNSSVANSLRTSANKMSSVTLQSMYLQGQGYWKSVYNGSNPQNYSSPVPTVVDFCHIGRYLYPDLTTTHAKEMTDFFTTQLLAPDWTHWIRALGTPDGEGSERADHGTTGAYIAWPSLSIETFALLDKNWTRGLSFFERFVPFTRIGPFGQAGEIQEINGDSNTPLLPVFKAPTWPYLNIAGTNFADIIIRTLFGYQSQWLAQNFNQMLIPQNQINMSGFVGTLSHIKTSLGPAIINSDGISLYIKGE